MFLRELRPFDSYLVFFMAWMTFRLWLQGMVGERVKDISDRNQVLTLSHTVASSIAISKQRKYRILPRLFGVQAAKAVVKIRFNCLVYVIDDAVQLMIFVGVHLLDEKGAKKVRKSESNTMCQHPHTQCQTLRKLTWCRKMTPFCINDFVSRIMCCWCTSVSAVPCISR